MLSMNGVPMLRPLDLFDANFILTPRQLVTAVEAFSEESFYLYRGFGPEGEDLFPELPISVDHGESYHLIYIYGLIHGHRPGKVLLQGLARVRGFKDLIHVAFEPLSKPPTQMPPQERIQSLNNLKKRLRHSIILLAQNAGLEPFNPSVEVNHVKVLPGVPSPLLECLEAQREG
jgi:hypothetical protein